MKILHVTQNYYPSIGGTQYTMRAISEYFRNEKNDDVTVITSNSMYGPNREKYKKIEPAEETLNGVTIKRFDYLRLHIPLIKFTAKVLKRLFNKPLPEFLNKLLAGPISASMQKAIDMSDADVIGASSIDYLFADYPIQRHKRKKPKPFVMYGALHLYNTKLKEVYKKRVEAADYYIANTPYEKQQLVNLGVNEEKIKVIGTGCDIYNRADFSVSEQELKAKYKIAPGIITITYIGRQEALKGLPLLLDAFKSIPSAHLFICGARGSYTDELEEIVQKNKNITLLTSITELQKTEVLRITDILVLPSKEESFGVVFLEAWSFSKPVIGANIGAVASLVEDGVDGLLFTADDAHSLAEKINILAADEALRSQLGINGNKKLLENYTWEMVGNKFRDVYQLAIKKFTKKQLAG